MKIQYKKIMLFIVVFFSPIWAIQNGSFDYVLDELIVQISPEVIKYPALKQMEDLEKIDISASLKKKLNEIGVQKIERILFSVDPIKATLKKRRSSRDNCYRSSTKLLCSKAR